MTSKKSVELVYAGRLKKIDRNIRLMNSSITIVGSIKKLMKILYYTTLPYKTELRIYF